jgi:flavin-dependent dehydrogenase
MQDDLIRTDVAILGGGLAGMASSIHLARAGLRVACIEPAMDRADVVGESLDWSAPELLRTLGLPMERLLTDGIATWKRYVVLQLGDGRSWRYIPGDWLARAPWKVELRTLHVDRDRLRDALKTIFFSDGATLIDDRVLETERDGKRVTALKTVAGKRIEAAWFVDASGSAARIFPRLFRLRAHEFGPRKVALWSYFDVQELIEGTTLHTEGNQPPYMDWVWEIPIHPTRISVGYVGPADVIAEMRREGKSIQQIYRECVSRIPRLRSLFDDESTQPVHVTSFRCGVYRGIAGPNWLVTGESAAMIDPMTSNGVTAALRTAQEASSLIVRGLRRGRLPGLGAALYSLRVAAMACFFNSGIEHVVYDAPVRNAIGVGNAGRVYTIPAWLMNLFYTRLQPRGLVSTLLFSIALSSLRGAAAILHWLCSRRQNTPRPGLASA